ncbi:MAG: hypothetical protein QNK37_01715 [Acidobacteriota bacterium]|nr:hypothetical protein [Acidobacteriota bacterium]
MKKTLTLLALTLMTIANLILMADGPGTIISGKGKSSITVHPDGMVEGCCEGQEGWCHIEL